MAQHQKRPPVFKPAEEDGQIPLDPPSAEEVNGGPEEPIIITAEKVTEPVPVTDGWSVIGEEQQTGKHYIVTHIAEQTGVIAFWRKTRRLSHFRWVLHGTWTNMMNQELIPQPIYYKETP